MIFKSTAIAVFASSLLTPAIAIANNSDMPTGAALQAMQSSFTEQPEFGSYAVTLKADAAGLQLNDPSTQAKLADITKFQDEVFSYVKSYDPDAELTLRTRLLTNILSISMNKEAANALTAHTSVASVSLIAKLDQQSRNRLAAKDDEEWVSGGDFHDKYPFLKVNDAGDNITVALIGPGVDYTHTALGGKANDDFDNYGLAFQNVTNAWQDFPNDVVIGGFDFASESGGYDYNPLEYHSDITDRRFDTLEFKAGYGTMTAGAILNAVPNAKILAYKVEGVSYEGDVFVDSVADAEFVGALELAVDPNLDGDISDRADIIVISRSFGGMGFADDRDGNHSSGSVTVQLVRDAAATGALIIAGAGNFNFDSYYNIATRGLAPEVLTVGFAHRDESTYIINPNSPIGPTRGPLSYLKPDVVSVSDEMVGPRVASNVGYGSLEENDSLSIARAAAAAVSVMDSHPQLTSQEVKALLVNTGINKIENAHGVAQIGGGSVNPIAASTSPALMYQKGNYQPSLNFSQVKVFDQSSFSKEVVIKNLSDKTHHYNAVIVKNGDKTNNAAVSVSFPEKITLAPNSEITVPVTITVNADKLAENPFLLGSDYSADKWDDYAVNGNIVLEHETSPGASIHMPWLIMPSRGDNFLVDSKHYDDSWTYIRDGFSEYTPPHDSNWNKNVSYAVNQDYNRQIVQNVSSKAQTLYALPIIFHIDDYRDGTPKVGNIIKTIAGDLSPEAQCESGQKLTLAITYFAEFQQPTSKHYDRIPNVLTSIQLYNKEAVEQAEYKARILDQFQNSPGHLSRLDIRLDENQQLATQFVDQRMSYNPYNPLARYKWSKLETVAAPGGDTVVTNICTDNFFHGPISADTFNEIIGFQFTTDRDNVPGYYDDVLTHNFKLGGHSVESEIADEEEPVEVVCAEGFIKDVNNNCVKIYDEDIEAVDLADFIAESFGEEREEFNFHCGSYDEQLNTRCTASHSKTFDFEFPAPNRNPDGLLCDFRKESTSAICYPKNLVRDNGDIEDKLFWRVSLNTEILFAPKPVNSENSFLTGVAIKMKNASVPDADANWSHKVTLQPGERALVSYLRDSACSGGFTNPNGFIDPLSCTEGGYVFDLESGFKRIATNNSSYSRIAKGQEFSVAEDAQIGDVLGTVRITNKYLQETYGVDRKYFQMMLIDAGFGAPFHLSSKGVLSVRDPEMLDFEKLASYQLKISMRVGNSQQAIDTIVVNVRNANDSAPEMVNVLEDISATQDQAIENINLAPNFSDLDGIGLMFSASDLPAGLALSKAGILSGTPSVFGEFTATIKVSDGVQTVASDLTFFISENKNSKTNQDNESSGSSGGSVAMMLFALFVLTRRRLVKSISKLN